MGVVVQHDKRKREILDKALDVFVIEGYEDATFQKIADRCGISRTTLYTYFKTKKEIFTWSLKQLTESLEKNLQAVLRTPGLTNSDKLQFFAKMIIGKCVENHKLFNVVLAYLFQIQKSGKDPNERVRHRTIRLRHLLSKIILDGIKCGEFKEINIKAWNELFYGLIESIVFRLAILNQENVEELLPTIEMAIAALKK